MTNEIKKPVWTDFRDSESGAVTVDWVVITAAVVGLGITAMALIETEAVGLATSTGETISDGVGD
ncbi:hypothetical protein [uncultured Shimia sp.]|uniref:hypothetical protein n=1 Tax=uncultured Shimia sp. TaxID=573152 RepID=UPI00260491FE|nr:hypothetical protein [uncultured Shimia sp.]